MRSRARCWRSSAASRDLVESPGRIRIVNRREFVLAAALAAAAPRSALAAAEPAGPRVLVTADLESRVLAVDGRGRIRDVIATLAYPRSIEAAGTVAVVAHSELGAVSLIDLGSLRVAHVLRGFGEPRYTAAHPDGLHAYVTDAARGELVTLDLRRGHALGRARVGPRARHVTIDPAGMRVWVALGSKAEEVALVDVRAPARPRLVARFRPPFLAHDVACAPDGRHLWVSSGDQRELAVYDAHRERLLARPSGYCPPQHVTFAAETAYVTSGWSGTLRLHRIDGRSLGQVPIPVGSYNVQHGFDRVVTPSLGHGMLTILDERGRLLRSTRVAKSSHDACLIR
jgi:DNA-binding beta-propeller fold protein YncE